MHGNNSTERLNAMNKMLAGGIAALGILTGTFFHNAAAAEPVAVEKGKVAVVYFSWSRTGNTRFAAQTICTKLGGRLFEIKPLKPYSRSYQACCMEAKPECTGRISRPIRPVEGLDLAQFEVVFVGTPNWYGTIAPPVRTWILENAAVLREKTVCLFLTHGGGGMQRVAVDFAELLPEAKILPPEAFPGKSIRSNVASLEKYATDRVTVK